MTQRIHETDVAEDSLFVEDPRFAMVPEWVIDASISDGAFRLYATLLRYGNSSGCRMPSRALLARRLDRSVDSIDRAMKDLVSRSIVRVEHRYDGNQPLTNRYHVRTSDPHASSISGAGRRVAATPGRRSAERVGADVRLNRESSTEKAPPPPLRRTIKRPAGEAGGDELGHQALARCGIADLDSLAMRCATARRMVGRSAALWTSPALLPAIVLAVHHRGRPPELVERALLALAGDPETDRPTRLAEAGPWWEAADQAESTPGSTAVVAELERLLDETDGRRALLQREARGELAAERLPLTRSTVVRRAVEILARTRFDEASPGVDGGDAA